ncbi:MAG: porin family protein [Sideroxydans sp.]|nr:porin family protein [Sideroxydans sp.]
MQKITVKIAFLLATLMTTSAHAQSEQFYLGMDAAMTYGATWKVPNTPDEKISGGTQFKPTLGYSFSDRWAMEISEFSVKTTKGSVSESIVIVPINFVYNVPFSKQTGLLLKVGAAPFSAKFDKPNFSSSDVLVGLSLGIGLKHQLSESIALVGGVDFLNGYRVKFSNGAQYDLSPANAYLGLQFGF